MEAIALQISAIATDDRRHDGRRRFQASARFVGRGSDERVAERTGAIDLTRLVTLLET